MVSKDTLFLIEKHKELEQKYEGKYIAIINQNVIADGLTIREVYKKTKKLKIKNPLIAYIPKEEEEALLYFLNRLRIIITNPHFLA